MIFCLEGRIPLRYSRGLHMIVQDNGWLEIILKKFAIRKWYIFLFYTSVHGGFSEWSTWTECDKQCGGGLRNKTRVCNNPPPQNNGNECVGELLVTEECNVQYCPGNLVSLFLLLMLLLCIDLIRSFVMCVKRRILSLKVLEKANLKLRLLEHGYTRSDRF